jgi:tetratricopeptide (TPR) repeat protein
MNVRYYLLLLASVSLSGCLPQMAKEVIIDKTMTEAAEEHNLGNHEKSIALYDDAIALGLNDTTRVIALTNRGRAKIVLKDTLGAVKDLDMALAISPIYQTLLSRAIIEMRLNLPNAANYLRKAKNLAPSEPNVYAALIAYYNDEMPNKDSALYYADYAYKHFAWHNTLHMLVMSAYLNYRRYDALIIVTNVIIQNDPNNAFAYNNRGFAKMQLGDYNAARIDIDKSIQLDTSNSYAFKNLGLLFLRLNQTDSACSQFTIASNLGYSKMYGPEVDSLLNTHCVKGKLRN